MLEHGFLVERRLGKGSTAVALKVEHDDGGGVLKVALDPSRNERIRREGEVLGVLRHPNVVAFHRHVELSGHAALFIAMAGTENRGGTYTLADRIREEGRLSLDLLERFGGQLLGVVQWLEEKGISHRDLKPDNIGVSARGADRSLALVVFDFSLADTPAENIRAGTPQYLDPFLRLRRPPRWDVYAERFAAAMTLHEMATGHLPGWGDGLTDPCAGRGGGHPRCGVARSLGARPAHRVLRQGAGQGLPGPLRQRGRDAPRVVRLLRGHRRPGHGRRGRR